MYRCLLSLSLALPLSLPSTADVLNIELHDIPSSEGTIMLQVCSGEADFASGDAVLSLMQRAREGSLVLTTDGLPPGEYAIRVYHDLDGNGEMDSNMLGSPAEPWGISNNAAGNFGPPGWEQARFRLEGETTQSIRLNQ